MWDPESLQLSAVVLHNVLFHPARAFEHRQPLMGSERVQLIVEIGEGGLCIGI